MIADDIGKKVLQIEKFLKFHLWFAFSGLQSWLIWKTYHGMSYFNKKNFPTASKISDQKSVWYRIGHISLLYLPKIMPPYVPLLVKYVPCLILLCLSSGVDCSPPSCKTLWDNQNLQLSNKLWVLINTSPFHTHHQPHMKMLGLSNHNLVQNKFLKFSINEILKYTPPCFKHSHWKCALL